MADAAKPLVVITGATGNIGRSLAEELRRDYRIVGLDRTPEEADFPVIAADFSEDGSVAEAFGEIRERFGSRIAAVVHLVAFFDFSGEESPLYRSVNVEGTRRLLRALGGFEVEQLVYASTMLVHAPGRPGERIDETQPIEPRWAYPRSKAQAEAVIKAEHGSIPFVLLRLAGVYDEGSMVPTLAQQMARIYDRNVQSHFYSGSMQVGQSMLHRADMIDAFRRAIDRRRELPPETELLIGEPEAIGYDDLQDEIGSLMHGREDWLTLRVPKPIAAAGAWVQDKLEPVVPDAVDQGEEPFIKPFMVFMADDHYALDISRARRLLGWEPRHRLRDTLPAMVANLKADPLAWYERNKVTPPAWLAEAAQQSERPEALRVAYETRKRRQHADHRWAHFVNMALGTWLLTQPPLIGVAEPLLRWSEVLLGAALVVLAALALSWRAPWARWACAAIGALVMAAPFLFWTESAAAYLSDTLVGGLIIGLAIGTPPESGPSPVAATTGPEIPPGWSYNPSAWTQRIPIIALALIGVYVSRYLAAYQLGHIEDVWDPFFAGAPEDPQNGTEEIITSSVSEAFPVSDAALGGYTYMLEIVTGVIGSQRRWRTMPWLVVLFGLMIAPLGVTSILFIVIQPVVIGTWSIIALIGAAAMLVQIPYALDELLASLQFLRRRSRAGQNWLRIFFVGDTDEGGPEEQDPTDATGTTRPGDSQFGRPAGEVVKDMVTGGVVLTWNLALSALIGLWLLFTRLTFGSEGGMANADHVIGSLVLTAVSLAAAEVARPLRFLIVPLGAALLATPFLYDAGTAATANSLACGVALVVLSIRRGPVRERYGGWNRLIV